MRMFKSVTHYMSITQAALILDISQPALSRRIKQLEDELSVKLLHRSGGKVELTPQGVRFLQSADCILAEHDSVRDEISSDINDTKGHIVLGLTHPMARWLSESFIEDYSKRHPNTYLSLVSKSPKDMVKMEGCDLMVSPILPEDIALIAKKLHKFKRYFCASPDYLRINGLPKHPDDLTKHQCIVNSSVNKNEKSWHWHSKCGNKGVSKILPAISTDSIDIAATLAIKGMGVASLPGTQLNHYFKSGELVALFDCQIYQCQDLYLVYRTREFMRANLKQLILELQEFYRIQYSNCTLYN
ncbi:LysR family transcriptional regulator [Shewanella sp. 5_MG-2023]|uniref:LysR family transcriptional regulator n=1 Tax=Shewanella sp. 5_MG-2023 TaxID=3062656 RepID=UPI0026E1FD5E|nr:LysR family transcriptional regulator [Shewanella sp. 5_MG-2023]MDO6640137.1 LysR family transcriptional regulator [Shewanella sp. 5_MG-2023]